MKDSDETVKLMNTPLPSGLLMPWACGKERKDACSWTGMKEGSSQKVAQMCEGCLLGLIQQRWVYERLRCSMLERGGRSSEEGCEDHVDVLAGT